jgi:hypothetical protein
MHRSVWISALVAGALACGATTAAAAPPRTGEALKQALPAPGAPALAGTTQYVGSAPSGRIELALVVAETGAAVAFLCDGTGAWRWYTGTAHHGRISLRSKTGTRLTGKIRGGRIHSVRTGGRTFALKRAARGSGLTRLVRPLGGVDVELGWISTNGVRIVGAGTGAGKLVATTDATASDPGETGDAVPAPGGDPVPFAFLGGIRCAATVLKIARQQGAIFNGTPGSSQAALDAQKQRFRDLNCGDEGFAIPPS